MKNYDLPTLKWIIDRTKKEMAETEEKIITYRKYGVYVLHMSPEEVEMKCYRLAHLYHTILEPELQLAEIEYAERISRKLQEKRAAIDFKHAKFPVLDHKGPGKQITMDL